MFGEIARDPGGVNWITPAFAQINSGAVHAAIIGFVMPESPLANSHKSWARGMASALLPPVHYDQGANFMFRASTAHGQIWHGTMADGSVQAYDTNIDEFVWLELLTAEDGDPVDPEEERKSF